MGAKLDRCLLGCATEEVDAIKQFLSEQGVSSPADVAYASVQDLEAAFNAAGKAAISFESKAKIRELLAKKQGVHGAADAKRFTICQDSSTKVKRTALKPRSNFSRCMGVRSKFKKPIFDQLAKRAMPEAKTCDVSRSKWTLDGEEWQNIQINLKPIRERGTTFRISSDVYRYKDAPKWTLIVDFANKHVGGGCFGHGFVQEEQMVAQSTDFAILMSMLREYLSNREVATYEGVHMDVWWDKVQCKKLNTDDIRAELSKPLVIIAADAPDMKRKFKHGYDRECLQMLARKVYMCFAIQERLSCPQMFTGLLGGGDFLGNRALVLLVHCLLQTDQHVLFHNPIFGTIKILAVEGWSKA